MTTGQPQMAGSADVLRRRNRLATFDLLSPQPIEQRLNITIAVAILMSLAYALGMLIDSAKPPLPNSPLWFVKLVPIPFPAIWHVTEVVIIIGWCIAAVAGTIGLLLARTGSAARGVQVARVSKIIVLTALLLPYAILPITVIFGSIGHLLLCVPTTAFGLWLLQRMQRFRKLPLRLPLMGFGWGAVIAAGFSICMTGWFAHYAANFFLDFTDPEGMQERLFTSMALNSGVFSELGKIAGIALLFLFYRRHVDNIVSGIVIGAAVGLGFNFTESLQYMNAGGLAGLINPGGAASQYWSHQFLGLMAFHVAFSAIAGAGFGVARQLREPKQRWIAVICGCLTAIGAHFTSDIVHLQFLLPKMRWSHNNPWFETLVTEPLLIAITSGLFVVLYLILLSRGHRSQANGLSAQTQAEASTGLGAITPEETPILLSPTSRFFIRINTLRNIGLPAYRLIRNLHTAQLELVTSRWHRARRETDPDAIDESVYRNRVLALKRQLATSPAPIPDNSIEVTP